MKTIPGLRHLTLCFIAVLFLCGIAVAQQPHTLAGNVSAPKSLHLKILGNDRDVIVYVPPGYEASKGKRYAVF